MLLKLFKKNTSNIRKINPYKTIDISENISYTKNNENYYSCSFDGYMNNVIAFRAIRTIATSVSSVEIIAKNIEDDSISTNQQINSIIKKPNNLTSYSNFIEEIISYLLINGNTYILKIEIDDMLQELHILRPDRISVLTDRNNIIGYKYSTKTEKKNYFIDPETGDSNILHIKNFHPLNDIYGFSPLSVATNSIKQHNYAGQWNCALLKNSARPSGALIVKNKSNDTLSEDQYIRIKDQIDELYSGYQNTGKPILLEGGIDWKEMSISPKDMEFIEIRNSSAREIALAIGIPPQILGIPGDNTYSNLIEARIALWEQTILPMLNSILSYLNDWVFNKHKVYLSYSKDSISIMSSRREKIWSYINDSNFMTENEKREALGLPKKTQDNN